MKGGDFMFPQERNRERGREMERERERERGRERERFDREFRRRRRGPFDLRFLPFAPFPFFPQFDEFDEFDEFGEFPQQSGPPSGPPPSFIPQEPVQAFAVDPRAIRNCLFRFTFVWTFRSAFWFFPTFVGRTSVSGFRWTGFNWVYFGVDLNRISSFICY
jgi:hypothetical protein